MNDKETCIHKNVIGAASRADPLRMVCVDCYHDVYPKKDLLSWGTGTKCPEPPEYFEWYQVRWNEYCAPKRIRKVG